MKRVLYVGNKLTSFGYTPTGIDFLGSLLVKNGYSVMFAGEKKCKMARLISIIRTILTERSRYDLIIVDTYSSSAFYISLFASWTARIVQKPYMPILRGGNLPSRLKESQWLTRQVILHAYRVISVSPFLQEEFSKLRPVVYIPNSIQLERYPFKRRHKLSPRLLWVRSLHRIYNPELAVRCIAALRKEFPSVFLTMVGPDKDGSRRRVEELAEKLGVTANICLTGKLSKDDWIRLADDHDIFINTTNFDNMPVSVVEAMALGLPIVSTKVGGIPFLLQDGINAHLVPPNNVSIMTMKINEILTDPTRSLSMVSEARKKAEEFDEKRIFLQWKNLLEEYA